jgi:hypothetical protein
VLALYRRLIWLRRGLPALTEGSFRWCVRGEHGVLAYLREAPSDEATQGQRVLVAIATGREGGEVDISNLPGQPVGLLSSLDPEAAPDVARGRLRLRPLEAVVIRLD